MVVKNNLFLDFFNKTCFTQSLKLLEAKYKLDIVEQKLVEQIIMNLKPDKRLEVELDFVNLQEVLALPSDKAPQKLKDAGRHLLSRVLSIKSENKTILQTHWIEAISYQEQKIVFRITSQMKPFFLQLQNIYAYLNIPEIMKMKSQYSGCIYIILKYYHEINNASEIRFTLQELTELLGCSYKKYFDLKKNVLEMLEKDINKNTDMTISYLPEKIGRKVEYIIFKFKINKLNIIGG